MPDVSGRRDWRAALAALAIALGLAAASAAAAKPPVWVVRSPKATLVLFGSVHLLPAGLDWRPAALDDALAKASELWFELPIDPATENQAAETAIARGALPKDRRLSALLTPGQQARLGAAASALNCPPAALDRMQPWMADLTLSVADDVRGGADASNGVESQVQALAPPTVVRHAFETAAQQVGFLAGAPLPDQVASLNATVDEIDDDPSAYGRIVGEWMTGDMAGLWRDAVSPVARASPRLYGRLISARNRRWARLLGARLASPGQIVVVVGVGHLIGPAGLPALLRAQGFQVEGP
jgi:uncharacterized protein YbaP (TraB family)